MALKRAFHSFHNSFEVFQKEDKYEFLPWKSTAVLFSMIYLANSPAQTLPQKWLNRQSLA